MFGAGDMGQVEGERAEGSRRGVDEEEPVRRRVGGAELVRRCLVVAVIVVVGVRGRGRSGQDTHPSYMPTWSWDTSSSSSVQSRAARGIVPSMDVV